MSMNTMIQINSYFDILIYAQRSLYVKCYSSCIHENRTTYYFIFRHFMTRRLFDIFIHYNTSFVSTRFWLHSTSCLYLSNMFSVEHEAQTYMYRHYLTLFDIIWHNLISFFVYFCHCLSNVFWYRTWEGRMSNAVAIYRKGRVVSYFDLIRQNSPAQLPQKTYGSKI